MTKKQRILLSAQEQFGKHGFTGTTLKMVADHAGVAAGLVSHYFGNKDSLFLESGGALIDQMLTSLKEKAKEADTGLEALRIFIESYLEFTAANRTTFPTLLRCSPFSDENPQLDRNEIASKFLSLINQIEIYLKRGMKDGSVKELPMPQTSFLIYGNIVGAVRTEFLTPYEIPELFEEACQFIIRSVAAH